MGDRHVNLPPNFMDWDKWWNDFDNLRSTLQKLGLEAKLPGYSVSKEEIDAAIKAAEKELRSLRNTSSV